MIEFRAECGHTVRAKDHDAGETVRCTYCGQDAIVPSPEDRSLDHLLTDDEPIKARASRTGAAPIAEARDWLGRHSSWLRAGLSVTYLAIVLTVVGYAGSWVWNMLDESAPRSTSPNPEPGLISTTVPSGQPGPSGTAPPPLDGPQGGGNRQTASPAFAGLSRTQSGLTIESVPSEALVYVAPVESAPDASTPARDEGNYKGKTPLKLPLSPRAYVVSLAIPVTSRTFRAYPDFTELRQRLEQSQDPNAARTYFLPDEADRVTLDRSGRGPLMITRHYRVEVPARPGAWTAVTGLFVPDRPPTRLESFLPETTRYAFDVEDTRSELDFYQVPADAQDAAVNILYRVGKLVIRTSGTRAYRVFQLQPAGEMWSEAYSDRHGAVPAARNSGIQDTRVMTETLLKIPRLIEVLERVGEMRSRDEPVDPVVWSTFLPGGAKGQAFLHASPAVRIEWISLIPSGVPSSVTTALGDALVNEDAPQPYTVRRAIIDAFERIEDPTALQYLAERSRKAFGQKSRGAENAEIEAEFQALKRVRNKLKAIKAEREGAQSTTRGDPSSLVNGGLDRNDPEADAITVPTSRRKMH